MGRRTPVFTALRKEEREQPQDLPEGRKEEIA